MGFFGELFSGDRSWVTGMKTEEYQDKLEREKNPNPYADFVLPEFKEDPDYRETQDFLKSLGIDILNGEIPDYYKAIGETGGSEFDNYLNQITGDIKQSALETAAATGRGGGMVTDITNEAVSKATTQARYADYERAMQGKQTLLNTGIGITFGS